ncbi:MAG: GDP-mannose 4,6-dehydratase [Emcibacter sp.]|nr:GDP-mannose 4,6-dehydratase [Emcibacter sp.]
MTSRGSLGFDLIIGASGQDGYYLQQLLGAQGRNFLCLDRNGLRCPDGKLSPMDICDATLVGNLLQQYPIERIFYLAAYHHSAEQKDANHINTLKISMDIHVYALEIFLTAIREYRPDTKIFYAASSHLFSGISSGEAGKEVLIDEQTPLCPKGWYGLSKAAGVELIRAARKAGTYAVAGFLFNHESARRPKSFLSSKLTYGALDALLDPASRLELLDVNARVDWGYAPDYVKAMYLSLDHSTAQDYVIATGKLHSIADYARQVYDLLGLDWQKFVTENSGAERKEMGTVTLVGNSTRLRAATGWKPEINFEDMVARILLDTARERNISLEGKMKGIQYAS